MNNLDISRNSGKFLSYWSNLVQTSPRCFGFFSEIYGMWWSGASDDDREGKFKWTHSNLDLVYSRWGNSEPNGGPVTENCGYDVRGQWETTKCELLYPYVCERGQWNSAGVDLSSSEWIKCFIQLLYPYVCARGQWNSWEWISLQVNGWSALYNREAE